MTVFKLGVCTWTFGDQPFAKTAERLGSMGFDGVELLGDLSLYPAAKAREILYNNGLTVFSITPDNVDIAHPERRVRETALEYYFQLLDFASELGEPLISVHGLVGRIAPLSTMKEEDELLIESVRQIATRANSQNLKLVFEVLNRYETHQIHTGKQALALIEAVEADNVGVLLDAYHMNIEEADPAQAIRDVGDHLWLYHAGDSNRQAVGRGHTDFGAQVEALKAIGYEGPVILEMNAPGPNPFSTDKGEGWRDTLETFLTESKQWFEAH